MHSLIKAAAVIAVLVVPAVAFAQSSEPVTRAQVRAQLVQLEKAGYNPNATEWGYPQNLIHAEAIVAQEQANSSAAYGPALNETVQSGK